MSLYEKHIQLVEAVNKSKTEWEHSSNERFLRGWRQGMEDAGINLSYMACDLFYLDQGIDVPMCCGVFLNWHPTDDSVSGEVVTITQPLSAPVSAEANSNKQ